MTNLPSIIVRVGASERAVRFDYAAIDRIEEATGLGFQEIADRFWSLMPADVPDGGRPTSEQITACARKFRVGFAAKFVAGCLGASLAELSDSLPAGEIMDAFNALAPGFVETFSAMARSAAEKKGLSPTPASGGPGPGSTSGSEPTSSAGSVPAILDCTSANGASASDGKTSGPASSPPPSPT